MRNVCVDALCAVGLVLVIVAIFLGVIASSVNYITFPGDKVAIEELRAEAIRLDGQSTDVTGLVVRTNCEIKRWQRYNEMGWIGWAIPNGWDLIETIQVPRIGQPNGET